MPSLCVMKRTFKLGISALIAVTLHSCDFGFRLTGTVIDAQNRLPLDSVAIYWRNGNHAFSYTDSAGTFDKTTVIGGLFRPRIPAFTFEKKGYRSTTYQSKKPWTQEPVTIMLEKEAEPAE